MAKGKLKSCGQLWLGEDSKENTMLSGYVDLGVLGRMNVLVFKNNNQKEATHPDYIVFVRDGDTKEEVPMPPKKGL